ncbi:MAG: DegV family protein [Clostridia bacterium]|nr:DegV family protein [Clostridia bacterium]
MTNNFVLLTDSSADLNVALQEELDVEVMPLTVSVDGGDYIPGNELDIKCFYDSLRLGKSATTSAINLDTAIVAMEKYLSDGKDLLYVAFSSGLSSTAQTGKLAADELREKYPDRKIFVVDSLCASLGQGLLVYYASQLRNEGKSIEEVRDWLESNKLNLCHWFTVDDLHHLKRGGRVSAATAVVGTMLSIKPVLHVDNEGHLINVSKARGRKPSIQALAAKLGETGIGDPADQVIYISHGDCIEDAEYLAGIIREKYNPKKIVIGYVGAVIGAHSGPGTLALFFLGKER